MVRRAKASGLQNLVGLISDAINSHSRLSAAAAFQVGVLLGQVMNNTGALKGLKRTVAAAPGAIASRIPTFASFDSKPTKIASKRRAGAAARRQSVTKTRSVKRRNGGNSA